MSPAPDLGSCTGLIWGERRRGEPRLRRDQLSWHCCIERLRDHEAVNFPDRSLSGRRTGVEEVLTACLAVTGARADDKSSCQMIMRSLNATVPGESGQQAPVRLCVPRIPSMALTSRVALPAVWP